MNANSIYAASILPTNSRTIRVLHLLPGGLSGLVQGKLHLLDLDAEERRPYECLSYVWGTSTDSETAIINDTKVTITRNLHDALCHIRSRTQEVVIWADALCIKQDDPGEKSQQVAFMDQIYRQCSRVYIWLGLPEESSLKGNPFAFLEHWASGRHFYELPGFARNVSTEDWVWNDNEACTGLLNDFLQVANNAWFTRAWTVQECLLPEDSIVMFGNWTATWDLMIDAERMKASHGDGAGHCCYKAVNAFNPPQLKAINDWMYNPGRVGQYMKILRGQNPSVQFFNATHAFSSRQCEKPLDKIYSMLALATNPIYQDFKPNYYADVPTVYTEVFTRMLREADGNFACFMGGGFGSTTLGLPSWVRDFFASRPLGVIGVEERRIWNMSLYSASQIESIQPVCNKEKELQYEGTYADTVHSVGISSMNDNLGSVFHEWLDMCRKVVGPCEPSTLRDTFSRILCADVCLSSDGRNFRRAQETDFPDADTWTRLVDGDTFAPGQRGYGWGVYFGMSGRCFFTTTSGRMGLCQPNTKAGDEVWIMSGVSVPFIVRSLQPSGSAAAEKYIMLGDCFLHEVMDGELVDKEKGDQRRIIFV